MPAYFRQPLRGTNIALVAGIALFVEFTIEC
jgi:hypothetical protein